MSTVPSAVPALLKDVMNPWLLGADPEFAVLTPPDVPINNAGPHAVNTTKASGQIGFDHSGRVWELRPAPSPSAYVVTTNLWKLLCQTEMDKLEKFKWKSGALGGRKSPNMQVPATFQQWLQSQGLQVMGPYVNNAYGPLDTVAHYQHSYEALQQNAQSSDTLGGHVHFGISTLNPAQRTALNDLTTGLLNLDILPQKENTKRLSLTEHQPGTPQYGHIGGNDAVRGCNGHVEYRCAPSWLDKPGQALAALTCYKLAAARPSSLKWPKEFSLKNGLLDWLDQLSSVDVDAWLLATYVDKRGFESIQADPSSDFKSKWRCATQEWGRS